MTEKGTSIGATESLIESEIRFLEYRLEVIRCWSPSPKKHAAAEAVFHRLTAIARSAGAQPRVDDLLGLSCLLMDDVFSGAANSPADDPAGSVRT
jgi:hypothetical protein